MSSAKWPLWVVGIGTPLYIVLNVATVANQFIPGIVTYFFWGIIGPLIAIVAIWFFLRMAINSKRGWVISSLVLTCLFTALGLSSLYYIGSLWASV